MNNNNDEESDILLHKKSQNQSNVIRNKANKPSKGNKKNKNESNNSTALNENELIHERSKSLVEKKEKQINNSIKSAVVEEDENHNKYAFKKHKYFPILHFLALLLCIIILYFAVVFHNNLQEIDLSYFANIAENLQKSPLQDVYRGKENC